MILAGKNLGPFCSRLLHVTCVAHGLHRIAEKVRLLFPSVNSLLSWSRKIFLKSPARISVYKEKMNCSLPPDVIITRWGSWISAALFFAEHFEDYCEVIEALPDDSKHIQQMKILLRDSSMLAADLTFINSYLGFIPAAIDKLQTRGLSLNAQIEIVEDVRTRLRSIPGSRGNSLQVKADEVFTKNRGYMTLRQLNDALISGTSDTPTSLPTSPVILSSYTYAPLTLLSHQWT